MAGNRPRTMTMSWHVTLAGAAAARGHLDKTVDRVATGGWYVIVRSWPFWRVEKRWWLDAR